MERDRSNNDSSKQENAGRNKHDSKHKHGRGGSFLPRGNRQGKRKGFFKDNNSEGSKKRKMYSVGKRLSEVDIGATEFISDYKGFSGIVKDRWSDFQVHEIAMDGSMAKLTTFSLPSKKQDDRNIEDLKKSLPEDIKNKLEQFIKNAQESNDLEIDVTDLDKDVRKCIHQISKTVPNVISQTEEKDKRKILVISNRKKNNKFLASNRRERWSDDDKNYLDFILHKINMDTMDALNQLAHLMRIKVSFFSYAGTKDRRAKTSQWVSLKRGNPQSVERAARAMKQAFLGNFKFSDTPQQLGHLKGNHFTIALRNVDADDETINLIMTSVKENGFINYFGLQRFGTIASIPTYEIGKSLLQGNWAQAVDLILRPRDDEQDLSLMEARKIYKETKNAEAALKKIERCDKIEAKLLNGINICGETNLQGALDHIPKNTLLMYIHSYQSLIWNIVVSKRIKEFGKKPIVGDLVYATKVEDAEDIEKTDDSDIEDEENADGNVQVKNEENNSNNDKEVDTKEGEENEVEKKVNDVDEKENRKDVDEVKIEDRENGSKKTENDSVVKIKDDVSEKETKDEDNVLKVEKETVNGGDAKVQNGNSKHSKKLPPVKILTEEDLPNYNLADVIMPMPGYKITYPPYAKAWYDEILAKDGLDSDLKRKNRKYALCGSYRKIIRVPFELSWETKRYENRNVELILGDYEEMRKFKLPAENLEGKYKALILKMSLPSSTYATCALREILKQDMSSQVQAAKSAAHD